MHTSPPGLPSRELVLLGAGHAHLHVLRMWARQPIPGVGLTLVTDSSQAVYSGMFPGVVAGLYSLPEASVDLWQFVPACQARLIVAPIRGLSARLRQVTLADRPPLAFDVASVALGSQTSLPPLAGDSPRLVAAKPLATLLERLAGAMAAIPSSDSTHSPARAARPLRVVVVGGGAAGFELTLALHHRLGREPAAPQFTLLDSHGQILDQYTAKTRATALRLLAERGIRVLTGHRVHAVRGQADQAGSPSAPLELHCTNPAGAAEPGLTADLIVWATTAAPPDALTHCDLPRDTQGFLQVASTLQSTSQQPVFAAGDCASFTAHPLRKAGVYAVRQGPVLWRNLCRYFAQEPLEHYRPQRSFLSLLSLADGRALADYRGLSWAGRGPWRLKDAIDRRFLRQYQDASSGRMVLSATPKSLPSPAAPVPQPMRCTGCGSKVGAEVLANVLRRLQTGSSAGSSAGPSAGALLVAPDDAVLLNPRTQPVDVWSVDFFPAFLDDPYTVGRIAALHSLSDVWAMGADPLGALAIVSVPSGDPARQAELLFQLLSGAVREFASAEASLFGGHTLEADLLQVGFSVVGQLRGSPAWQRSRLQPGDRLILTKPLGTGAILAGLARHAAPAPSVDAALASMLQSNAAAARVARRWPIQAATDITGFGLAGHLLEMLHASHCSARLELAALPLLPGVIGLTAAGIVSSLDPANRARALPDLAPATGIENHPHWPALFDPQTSGGLLLACPPDHAASLLADLHAAGLPHATCVGQVTSGGQPSRLSVTADRSL